MFRTRIDSLITNLRDHLCPPSLPDENGWSDGIIFNVKLWLSSGPKDERAYARVLFTLRTSVFVDVSWHGFEPLPSRTWRFWANPCNHDVCWRDSGVRPLTDVYFDMADRLDPSLPPALLNDNSQLGFLSTPPWELVRCKVVRDKNDPDNYRRVIEDLVPRK